MGRRRYLYLLSTLFSALLIFPWGVTQPPLLDDLRNFVFDLLQRAAPRRYDPETPVRVVGIDDESLATFGQWPWPRARLAELTDKLAGLGAAAIAFDFIFAEPDRLSFESALSALPGGPARKDLARLLATTPTNDRAFAKSIAAAPVVLGMTLARSGGAAQPAGKAGLATAGDDPAPFLAAYPAVAAPLGLLGDAARGLGVTNWLPDHDQVVRRVPLFVVGPTGLAPSLALEALRIARGETTYIVRSSNASGQTAFGRQTGVNAVAVGDLEIPTGAGGDIRPRYAPSAAARVISSAAVLQNRVARSEIEGRIIFVGALAAGLGDVRGRRWRRRPRAWRFTRKSSSRSSPARCCRDRTGRRGPNFSPRCCCSPSSWRWARHPADGDGADRRGDQRRAVFRVLRHFRPTRPADRRALSERGDRRRLCHRRRHAVSVRARRQAPCAPGFRQVPVAGGRRAPRGKSGSPRARRRDAGTDRAVFRPA